MNREQLGGFFERLGHRVTRGASCDWYDQRTRFHLAFPHSVPVALSPAELREVFAKTGAIGLRYVAPMDDVGRRSYALVVDDPAYDLDQLSSNTRSKVRRGLKSCEVRRVEPAFAQAHGRRASDDTLARLRFKHDFYAWDRYWEAVAATPDVEVWGALQGRELVSYLVIPLVEGCAEILVARSQTEALRSYPNNAVVFTAVQDLVRRGDLHRVLFGLESLEAVSGVDQFKESMGFRRMPIRQRIVFAPMAERLLRLPIVRRMAGAMARRRSESEFWRKVQGVLIFHESLEEAREESTWTS
jgi:hypothetical protein